MELMRGKVPQDRRGQDDRAPLGVPVKVRLHTAVRCVPSALNSLVITVVLIGGGFVALYPFFYTLISSLKTRLEFAQNRFGLPTRPTIENYREAFDRLALGQLLLNSFITTLGGVLLTTVVCLLAAYAVTQLRFPGRNIIFLLIVATLMIPFQTIMFPLYQTMLAMQLADQYYGLILAYGAFGLPLGTYLLVTYFRSIPHELIEAAIVDGANHVQILIRVLVPISTPAIAALAILNSVWMWNDLLLPLLIISSQEHMTLMVGISLLQDQYDVNIPLMSAGLIVATLPIVAIYLAAQTQLIKGLTAGAVK